MFRIPTLLFGLIFGVFFLAVGSMNAFGSAQALIEALASESWPKVDATIISTGIETTAGKYRSIAPKVSYQYTVNKTTYNGSRIWLLEGGTTENITQETIHTYQVNTVTLVSYKPENPEISVLRPGPTWFNYFWLIVAWLAIGVGSTVVYFSWVRGNKKS
jgi:Protein of unknown function (DUF3592)